MSDESGSESWDVDRDGIPDTLDLQVDPAPFDDVTMQSRLGDADADGIPDALDVELTPAGERTTEESLLDLQAKKERESLMTSTLTNIANMKHESLKGITKNIRG